MGPPQNIYLIRFKLNTNRQLGIVKWVIEASDFKEAIKIFEENIYEGKQKDIQSVELIGLSGQFIFKE